jgi:predicted DNA-binding transcriptional regulator AlpA
MKTQLLRVNQVKETLGVSKSQVWALTKQGELKSHKLSPRCTVWKLSDIEAYIASKCDEVA